MKTAFVLAAINALLKSRGGAQSDATSPIALPKMGRDHLPALCRELEFTKGAEIGVWRGAYSAKFCEANPNLHMLCVDPWESYQAWLDTKNSQPTDKAAAFMEESYQDARKRLDPLNCTILRKYSADAAKTVRNGSLDFVYIDGNHAYEAVMDDLAVWSPKVRSGGFVAGHDYRVFSHKPFIHVVRAVNYFTQSREIDPWFILTGDKTPSFLWVKP